MGSDSMDSLSPITRRGLMSSRSRRPWLLIVAALLLAVLSTVLWAKWEESRVRAERLQAEIKQVYAETEALRTQAARAQQRVTQLERQLREAPPVQAPAGIIRPKNPRTRP
jgi:cell division protein FtsB